MKKPKTTFVDPPEVAEVRRWRAKMVKRAGGTVKGLMSYLRELEAERLAAEEAKGRSSAKHRRSA